MKTTEKLQKQTVNLNDLTPFYEQVRQVFLARIESGEWQAGQRLPTDESLANELAVHYQTVRRALRALTREKYLVRRRGRGTFVADQRVRQHVGLLFGADLHGFAVSPFYTLLAQHAQELFETQERDTKIYLVSHWLRKRQGVYDEDFVRAIKERTLGACLVVGGAQFDAADSFELLLRHSIPFVIQTGVSTNYPSVGFDVEALARQGVELLAAQGYRKIAVVYGRFADVPVLPTEEAFFRGYVATMTRLGLPWRREWIKDEREPGEEAGYHAMKELWALGDQRPDAVLCCDDVMTKGIIHAWWELGVQVPRDLGFVTHCNKGVPLLYPSPLTRLECDAGELARAAGEMLLALLEKRPLPRMRVTIQPKLIAGQSGRKTSPQG